MDRVAQLWPKLTEELRAALRAGPEPALADQVDDLSVAGPCGCGDAFCQGFSTQPVPDGGYPDQRSIWLDPPWQGMLVVDVVDDRIVYVEILFRPALD